MGVCEGVIMAADRQITQLLGVVEELEATAAKDDIERLTVKAINEKLNEFKKASLKPITKTARKLFTMSDNIGVSMGNEMYNEQGLPMGVYVDFFCRNNTFDKPHEAAVVLLAYLRKVGGNVDTILHLAGYDKSNIDALSPEMYHLSLKDNKISGGPDLAFWYGGFNDYFKPFYEKINDREKKLIFRYSLQDAAIIAKTAIDMSRFLSQYIDFKDGISDDIEMIGITPNGIQWLRKAELEIK
jgi:hypothetical protein